MTPERELELKEFIEYELESNEYFEYTQWDGFIEDDGHMLTHDDLLYIEKNYRVRVTLERKGTE